MSAAIESTKLPWNETMEQSLIGSLLQDPDALLRIADKRLLPAHLFDPGTEASLPRSPP